MAFPPLGNSDHIVLSVSIDFPTNSQRDARYHRIAYYHSRADWDGLRDHLRDVLWEDIFKLGTSAAASKFCEWVRVGVDPSWRVSCQVSFISVVFGCLCCCHYSWRSLFCLYQGEKSSDSKMELRQASDRRKRVLEAAKLSYANKTKESIASQKLGSRANSVLNKGKSAIPPLFSGPGVLSSASGGAKLFAEGFSMSSNLDDSRLELFTCFPCWN